MTEEWSQKEKSYLLEIENLKKKIKELEEIIQNEYILKISGMSLALAHARQKDIDLNAKLVSLQSEIEATHQKEQKLLVQIQSLEIDNSKNKAKLQQLEHEVQDAKI